MRAEVSQPRLESKIAPALSPAPGRSGRPATFEGDSWERDADRRVSSAHQALGSLGAQNQLKPPRNGHLPSDVLTTMERGFQHDFSAVRVFCDAPEASAARARAVALDHDLYFAPGQYSMDMLSHELAHVAQRDQGAPAMAYRHGENDLRNVTQAMRQATRRLHQAAAYLPTREQSALVDSMSAVLSDFFPRGYGTVNATGVITRASHTGFIDSPVRRGGVNGTYRHELTLYLSEETATEQARYAPTSSGGEIRIFVHNVSTLPQAELIATLAHELVHAFTNIMVRAQSFAHRMRSSQAPLPAVSANTNARQSVIPISITLADPTLRASSSFQTQLTALGRVYEPVVEYLNQQRLLRGEPVEDRAGLSASWAIRTADELLAYVIDQQVDVGVQLASGRGRGRVAMTDPLDPALFFRNYAGRHWVGEADRIALARPEAAAIIARAGHSQEMQAVFQAISNWVTPPASTPAP